MFQVTALICFDRLHSLKGNRLRRTLNGLNRSPDQKSWKDVSQPPLTEVPLSSTFKNSKEHHIDLLLSLDRHAVTLASDSQTTAPTTTPERLHCITRCPTSLYPQRAQVPPDHNLDTRGTHKPSSGGSNYLDCFGIEKQSSIYSKDTVIKHNYSGTEGIKCIHSFFASKNEI